MKVSPATIQTLTWTMPHHHPPALGNEAISPATQPRQRCWLYTDNTGDRLESCSAQVCKSTCWPESPPVQPALTLNNYRMALHRKGQPRALV